MTSIENYTIKASNKYKFLPLSSQSITLHALDNINVPVAISNHRFFRRPSHLTPQHVIDTLKSSLAEALELYPPVAGTIRANEKGEAYIALDNEGALFVIEVRDSPFIGDGDDLSPRPVMLLPTPSSAFAVKVTQFSCGTIAVCSSIHHWVCDLRAYLDFLGLWAKIARLEAVDLQTIPKDWSHQPGRFFEPKQDISAPHTPYGYKVLPAPSQDTPLFLPAEAQAWKITASSLEDMKRDFSPVEKGAWISNGDALTTLVWGAITRARESAKIPHEGGFGRSSEESGMETIATAADGRERSPNKCMTGGRYFGNFNLLPITTVPRSDLLGTDSQCPSDLSQYSTLTRVHCTKVGIYGNARTRHTSRKDNLVC